MSLGVFPAGTSFGNTLVISSFFATSLLPCPNSSSLSSLLPDLISRFLYAQILWACPELERKTWLAGKTGDQGWLESGFPEWCRRRFRNGVIADHVSLTNRTAAELRNIFTMIRSPKTRQVSGYQWYFKHGQGKGKVLNYIGASQREICAFVNGTNNCVAAKAASVRMITGGLMIGNHFQQKVPEKEGTQEACERLKIFAFVGITEYFNASVCLFHAMHGGLMSDLELRNVRRGSYADTAQSLKEVDCGDQADTALYMCALQLFWERLQRFPQCLSSPTFAP